MTNIHIHLGQITSLQARAMSAMLTVMADGLAEIHVTQTTQVELDLRSAGMAEAMEVIELKCEPEGAVYGRSPMVEDLLPAAHELNAITADALRKAVTPVEPEATPEPAKRTRRTKAEMEAARAAEAPAQPQPAGVTSPSQMSEHHNALAQLRALLLRDGMTEAVVNGSIKSWEDQPLEKLQAAIASVQARVDAKAPNAPANPTLDDLRNALKAYVHRHGVDAGTSAEAGMAKGEELLVDFGCKRLTDLLNIPVKDQLEFIKLATHE